MGDDKQRFRIACPDDAWVRACAAQIAGVIDGVVDPPTTPADLRVADADFIMVQGVDDTHRNDPQMVRAAVLQRTDPREAIVTRTGAALPEVTRSKNATLLALIPSTRVQLAKRAPNVVVMPSPVAHDALAAVTNGEATALVAPISWLRAYASAAPGLVVRPLEHGEILHAPGSGIVSVLCRRDDAKARKAVAAFDDQAARHALVAERELLFHITGAHNDTPFTVAGHAETRQTAAGDERLVLLGLLMASPAYGPYRASHEVASSEATVLGRAMAATLLAQYQTAYDRRHPTTTGHVHDQVVT